MAAGSKVGSVQTMSVVPEKKYRISGHESFPCRYTWLPKAVQGLSHDAKLFAEAKAEDAMVKLGLGKNMVRSVRFWALATRMARALPRGEGHELTDCGRVVLGEKGLDPFLEDIRTLWLLHWHLSTDRENPLLAWDFLLNRWQEPEMVESSAVDALLKEATRLEGDLSRVTIEQHFETFIHTYVPTRGPKGDVKEDNLDCPLVELGFIVRAGERFGDNAAGRGEAIYRFARQEKPDITPELFVYCLNDFWDRRHGEEATVSFGEVAHGHGSPGQVFKLPEEEVRTRVEQLEGQTKGRFSYVESAALQQIRRKGQAKGEVLLKRIYGGEEQHG